MASGVKANWHVNLDVLSDGLADLWADEVAETGLPIELGDDSAKLSDKLERTVRQEAYLFNQGVTCQIKDREDTSCWACPVYRGDTDDPVGALCLVGREQERLLTRLAVDRQEQHEDQGQDTTPA